MRASGKRPNPERAQTDVPWDALRLSESLQEQDWVSFGADFGLTPQESIVARSLLRGVARRSVAASLSISLNTLKVHIRHIYAKLHINKEAGIGLRLLQFLHDV